MEWHHWQIILLLCLPLILLPEATKILLSRRTGATRFSGESHAR